MFILSIQKFIKGRKYKLFYKNKKAIADNDKSISNLYHFFTFSIPSK